MNEGKGEEPHRVKRDSERADNWLGNEGAGRGSIWGWPAGNSCSPAGALRQLQALRPRGTQLGQNWSSRVSYPCSFRSALSPRLWGGKARDQPTLLPRQPEGTGPRTLPKARNRRKSEGAAPAAYQRPRGAPRGLCADHSLSQEGIGEPHSPHSGPRPAARPTHPGPLSGAARGGRREQSGRAGPAPGNGPQRRSRRLGGPRSEVGAFWLLPRAPGDGEGRRGRGAFLDRIPREPPSQPGEPTVGVETPDAGSPSLRADASTRDLEKGQ